MKVDSLWSCLSYVFQVLSGNTAQSQFPLEQGHSSNTISHVNNVGSEPLMFNAPKDPRRTEGFVCEYPKMQGYKNCNHEDRLCWLKSEDGLRRFDINSDYENPAEVPLGITRRVRVRCLFPQAGWANLQILIHHFSSNLTLEKCHCPPMELLWNMARFSTDNILGLGLVSELNQANKK